jgi:CotH protein.
MKLRKSVLGLLLLFVFSPAFPVNEDLLFSPKGIAEIHITLADGKNIGDIQNEKATDNYQGKVKAEMTVKNSSSSQYEASELYNGKILIDGRGNTSWHRSKRPYNIDLVKEDWDTEHFAKVLDMPVGSEWCLLAFWNDRSLMRFPIASYLGQYLTGMSWVPRGRYAEVWINNDYRGLYYISEKIMRDDNRTDIKKLNAESTDLSGGYILEATPSGGDKSKPIETATQIKTSKNNINFVFKYPKAKNVTENQRQWILAYLNEFEEVLRSGYFEDEFTGYRKYINEDSFIDWTILHEMSKGVDNLFHASVFVHKDRNGKLNMSSPWDFDISYGNSGVYAEDETWVRTHGWFGRLYQDKRYAKKYNDRYDELKPRFDRIPEILQENYKQLEASGVLVREFNRFPAILNEYSDGEKRTTPTSYKGHVQFLSEWIESRNNWVYVSLGLNNEEKGTRFKTIKPIIRVMDPEGMEKGRAFEVQVMKSDKDINKNKYIYSWNDSSFGSSRSKRITQPGKYWLKMKDEWGNVSQVSDTLYFQVEPWVPTATDDLAKEVEFFTCSNPAQNILNIHFRSLDSQGIEIGLYDGLGALKKSETRQVIPAYNNIQMNVSDLTNGVYILQIRTKDKRHSARIVVKN